MNNDKRKILICGLGSIGRRYLRIINQNFPDIKIAAMRSGYGSNCKEIKLVDHQTYNLRESIDWEPDAAIISSPANLHVEQAIALGESRVPCLIEKPIGSGDESFEKWKKVLHLSNLVPMLIGYVHRHDPCVTLIKKKLEENLLGKVIEADFYCSSWLPKWRPEIDYLKSVSAKKELGGGVLLELSHEIDLANMLLGPIKLKYANLKPSGLLPIDVEDRAYLIAENSNGVLISIRLNFCSEPSTRKVTIRGKKGVISWNIANGKLKVRNDKEVVYQHKHHLDRDSLFLIQIKHFFDCVFDNQRPKCSVAEGKYVLEIVQIAKAIYKLNSSI